MTEPEANTQDALRDCILRSGHNDFVSMADVQSCIFGGLLADLSGEQQRLIVDTIRSLLDGGLVEMGVIPGRNDPGFKTWPGTVEEVMTRFVERFIGRHEDPHQWRYRIWAQPHHEGSGCLERYRRRNAR